jgi:hypothetical protein
MNTMCTDEGDVSDTCVPDPRLDSPSALTSGMVVCGNLTAALRSRRKRHDAWTEEDIPSALEPRKYIPEASRKLGKHFPVILHVCGSEKCSLLFWKEQRVRVEAAVLRDVTTCSLAETYQS